ncbi:MAG TPA: MMPL family transporter, partial [Pirellulales bacterium]|nr:MMPL family transporter [Pirellulales bacterium]
MNGPRPDRTLSNSLIRFRWPLLVAALAATALAYVPSQRLAFDRSIENMFAPDDPVLAPFRKLKRTFGGDEVALAAYIDADLLTTGGLARLETITADLAGVPGVRQTFSLSTVQQFVTSPLLATFRPKLLELSEGYTIGTDHQTAGIVCVLTPEHEAPVPRMQTVDQLRQRIEAHVSDGVLTGEPVMVVDGFRFLEDDGRLLGAVSTVLLMLTIVICFRSLRWVMVPMAVVGTTLVWTQASLVASHLHLSLVSSMLWAIVTVIGVATVLHLVISFREYRTEGLSARQALELAGDRLAAPIFWACATDAAGFGSLMVSQVGPVHDFGLMMLVGSLLALVSIALVVPGLSLAGRFDADPRRAWGEHGLDFGLR